MNPDDRETMATPPTPDSGGGAPAQPCLTILCHPDPDRIGERFRCRSLVVGQDLVVSRSEPAFAPPAGGPERPLADPHVSRKPTRLTWRWPVGLDITPAEGVVIDGDVRRSHRSCSASELSAGIVLELAGRVALLLHLSRDDAAPACDGLIGDSDAIAAVRRAVARVADLTVPVLIRGETGVGKERVARAIHDASPRAGQPFVAINMAAISPTTALSELFGHARGAFTGAVARHVGLFERADGGTLFLDELGATPAEIQPMLLRALETGRVLPVGGDEERAVDVRLVAATDADLEQAGLEGWFREPLYHRLAGCQIEVPPLRARRDDIARLLVHFLGEELERIGERRRLGPPPPGAPAWLPSRLVARLVAGNWPGNVRQLRNVARQLVISSRGQPVLTADAVVERLLAEPPPGSAPGPRRALPADETVVAALRDHGWSVAAVAAALGVAPTTLHDFVRNHPELRVARELTREEIEAVQVTCGGDLEAAADRLCVSKRGLVLRMRALGMS